MKTDTLPRLLSAQETGCVPPAVALTDSVYDAEGVDDSVAHLRFEVTRAP